jgi:hypothetical protein
LRITTVGSGIVAACSRSRSPPDYEFATDKLLGDLNDDLQTPELALDPNHETQGY